MAPILLPHPHSGIAEHYLHNSEQEEDHLHAHLRSLPGMNHLRDLGPMARFCWCSWGPLTAAAAFVVLLSCWQIKNSGGRNTSSPCKFSSDPPGGL